MHLSSHISLKIGVFISNGIHQMNDFQPYEFSGSQNELIKNLSDKMRFVSYFLIGAGVLITLAGVITVFRGGIGNIITGVVQGIIGIWTNKAASAFQRIVVTEGNDIENLMGALGELRKLYTLQYWLYIILLIFLAITLVLGLVAGVANVGR